MSGGRTTGGGSAAHLPVHERALDDTAVQVSTGRLPDFETVRELVAAAHTTFRHVTEGTVADYIPALAQTPADLFGIAVAGVGGRRAGVGDSALPFTIQSIAKPFVFALVCDALGHR
jgi:glutaminase